MPIDHTLAYLSKIITGATLFQDIKFNYNYLELEDDEIGIFDEPHKISFLSRKFLFSDI